MPEHASLISVDAIIHGHALSCESQPYLGDLFDELADGESRVTLLVGAGVSMDAGLFSWDVLVERLIPGDSGDQLLRVFRLDGDGGPLRRAEKALALAKISSPLSAAGILQTALYGGHYQPNDSPGAMATTLAELRASLGPRCVMATTNFDNVLEVALRESGVAEVHSFTLKKRLAPDGSVKKAGKRGRGWFKKMKKDPACATVMHLHGMLPWQGDALTPLVLTESQFAERGPDVKSVVEKLLRDTTVVMVGVSLSDPNLLEPLFRTKGNRSRFVFLVPSLPPGGAEAGLSTDDALRYGHLNAQSLERVYDVKPILLKSYGQLNQALRECVAASSEKGFRRSKRRYGIRFPRVLSEMYEVAESKMSADETGITPLQGYLRDGTLSDLLEHPAEPILRHWSELKDQAGDRSNNDEKFALFVWLRTRGPKPPYALDLVASSVYRYLDDWSRPQRIPIEFVSRYAAAMAAARNSVFVTDLKDLTAASHQWRGILAVPLSVRVGDDPPVTAGVITLNSQRWMLPDDSMSVLTERAQKPPEILPISLIKAYTVSGQVQRVTSALVETGIDFLSPR